MVVLEHSMNLNRFCSLLIAILLLGIPAAAQTTVTGAGATFPYPIYSKWFDEYHKLHPEIQIN